MPYLLRKKYLMLGIFKIKKGITIEYPLIIPVQTGIYCPLNGVPKIPTASSAQIRSRSTRRAKQIAIRYLILFIFLIASSHIRPVPSNRAPAIIKSNKDQFTSSVNCIAINGISNIITDVSTMIISLLFCIIINAFISLLSGQKQ